MKWREEEEDEEEESTLLSFLLGEWIIHPVEKSTSLPSVRELVCFCDGPV